MIEKRFDCILNEFDEIEYISDIVDCEDRDFADFMDYVNEMAKENEQLKQSIKEVVELLSEEVDVFSEKATEYDLAAYIELNQLDNKDAYYMATATKKAIKILKGYLND